MKPARIALIALTAATAAGAALAHHGWAGYGDEAFALTGRVVSADFAGPHGEMRVQGQGGTWLVVLGPRSRNDRAGLNASVVPAGTTVTARGHRHRDPGQLEMKTERLTVGGRTYDIYPDRT